MALVVKKFGGTSVGNLERMRNVSELALRSQREGNQVVLIVSAMSGETNRLLALAHQISSTPDMRELDSQIDDPLLPRGVCDVKQCQRRRKIVRMAASADDSAADRKLEILVKRGLARRQVEVDIAADRIHYVEIHRQH